MKRPCRTFSASSTRPRPSWALTIPGSPPRSTTWPRPTGWPSATRQKPKFSYLRAIALDEKARGKDPAGLAATLNNLALVYSDQERLEEAERLHERSLNLLRDTLGPSDARVAMALHNLAVVYRRQGRFHRRGTQPAGACGRRSQTRALGPRPSRHDPLPAPAWRRWVRRRGPGRRSWPARRRCRELPARARCPPPPLVETGSPTAGLDGGYRGAGGICSAGRSGGGRVAAAGQAPSGPGRTGVAAGTVGRDRRARARSTGSSRDPWRPRLRQRRLCARLAKGRSRLPPRQIVTGDAARRSLLRRMEARIRDCSGAGQRCLRNPRLSRPSLADVRPVLSQRRDPCDRIRGLA